MVNQIINKNDIIYIIKAVLSRMKGSDNILLLDLNRILKFECTDRGKFEVHIIY